MKMVKCLIYQQSSTE